jgi:hypothetical protein
MPEKGIRSTYSQSPFQILMNDENGLISTGTAFFFQNKEEHFLITNWHNLSGRHFLTDKLLSSEKRRPTFIEAKFATKIDTNNSFTTIAKRIEIYKDLKPLWLEHPVLGSKCDVVAIKMNRPSTIAKNMHFASNIISKIKIPVKPGNTVFVIGFPKSLSVAFGLPIWKSGYIASEPFYNVTISGKISKVGGLMNGTNLPAFFVDTQTREGMSGSPVFANYIGNWNTNRPYEELHPDRPDFWESKEIVLGENRHEFVGCYSGRIGKQEEGAALGLCWTKATIEEICNGNTIGKHPHING